MTNRVALLGVKGGPAIRPGSAMPTSTLVRMGPHSIVVDCGLGVARGLIEQDVPLATLKLVLITHIHSDHVLELGPLIHTAWTAGLENRVIVCGPAGLRSYWHHHCLSMLEDIEFRQGKEGRTNFADMVEIRSLVEDSMTIGQDLRIDAMRTVHSPLEEVLALRIEAAGFSIVPSGDTAYHPPLAEFAQGAHLLVHEAMLAEAVDALVARLNARDGRLKRLLRRSHTTAEDAARMASRAVVGALALNHLVPADDPTYVDRHWRDAVRLHWDGPLFVGKDGLSISLEDIA